MTIFGYARCSSKEQQLDNQLAQLKEAGAERIYQEKESGARTDRKELQKLIKSLKPCDVLMVIALDRLGRNLKDILFVLDTISKKGAKFRSLREPFFDSQNGEMG